MNIHERINYKSKILKYYSYRYIFMNINQRINYRFQKQKKNKSIIDVGEVLINVVEIGLSMLKNFIDSRKQKTLYK